MADKKNLILKEKPEFGNAKQIAWLKQLQDFRERMLLFLVDVKHKLVDVKVNVTITFPCPECGHEISLYCPMEDITDLDITGAISGHEKECYKCGCIYEMNEDTIVMTANPKRPWLMDSEIEMPEDAE